MKGRAWAPLLFARLWRIVGIATGAAAGIEAPLDDFCSLCLRQIQTLDAHLSPFRDHCDTLNHPRLRLLKHTRVELLADMIEHVFYGRGEVCVLKKLAHLAQIAAGLQIKQGGRRWPNVGQGERRQPVPFAEFPQTPERQSWCRTCRDEPALEQGVLAEIEEQLRIRRWACFLRQRFRVPAHELNQLHDPHLFAPIDLMKLLLLPASPRLIPDAVETLFINLMRDKTVSPKVPQGFGVDAGAGGDQDHKRYDLLSARRHVAGRVGLPDMVNLPCS